jgi:hypothetical protein
MGLVLCFYSDSQAMGLILMKEGGTTYNHGLCCLYSLLLKFLRRSMPNPFLLHNHLSWTSPAQTLWHVSHNCYGPYNYGPTTIIAQSQTLSGSKHCHWTLYIPPTFGLVALLLQ